MNASITTSEYLLLFRGAHWDKDLSAEQLQNAMSRFMAWFEHLKEEGIVKTGQPLAPEGKIVSGKNGRIVSDGPFAESKEAIGGYFLLEVDDFADALEIAKGCPMLEYGSTIEVRPAAQECPTFQRAKEQLAIAMA